MSIAKSKYRLRMNGNWLDEKGVELGRWDAKQVFLDDQELIYLFQVPNQEISGSLSNGLGRVSIHRVITESGV